MFMCRWYTAEYNSEEIKFFLPQNVTLEAEMAHKVCILPENTIHCADYIFTYQPGSKFTTHVFCVHHSTDLYSIQLFELIFYTYRYFAI
jgi:hypothetical protein